MRRDNRLIAKYTRIKHSLDMNSVTTITLRLAYSHLPRSPSARPSVLNAIWYAQSRDVTLLTSISYEWRRA